MNFSVINLALENGNLVAKCVQVTVDLSDYFLRRLKILTKSADRFI